jgi:hypothetical protein
MMLGKPKHRHLIGSEDIGHFFEFALRLELRQQIIRTLIFCAFFPLVPPIKGSTQGPIVRTLASEKKSPLIKQTLGKLFRMIFSLKSFQSLQTTLTMFFSTFAGGWDIIFDPSWM